MTFLFNTKIIRIFEVINFTRNSYIDLADDTLTYIYQNPIIKICYFNLQSNG